MITISDGKMVAEITMKEWDHDHYSPDVSLDILQDGSLHYDVERDAYFVESVDGVIDAIGDWKNHRGDFKDDYDWEANNGDDNRLAIVDIYLREAFWK